ncbi:MAG TPA: hypothetical protein VGM19_06850 [Armatimonadota bacterium]|jgi:hypothetical protein
MNKPSRVLTWLILLGAFYLGFAAGTSRLWDYDLWWHLRTGQQILATGAIPHVDPFSWTRPGAPWITHEWGWEVLLFAVYQYAGLLGIIYLKATLCGLCAALGAGLALRWGAGVLPALVSTSLFTLALRPWVNARPAMLVVLYVLVMIHLMTSARQGRARVLWWLPLLFLCWANTHGTFLIGWMQLAVFGFCSVFQPESGSDLRRCLCRPSLAPLRPLILPGLASVAVCLLNPSGVSGFLYPFSYLLGENSYHAQIIAEYASPDFHNAAFLGVEVLMIFTLVAVMVSPLAPTLWEGVLLTLGLYLFLKWSRNGPLLAVFCLPIAARHLTARLRVSAGAWLAQDFSDVPPLSPAFRLLAAAVLLATLVLLAPKDPRDSATVADNMVPVRAVEVISLNGMQGPMFNSYDWGGYLLWKLWPRYQVYIDGRADMYGTDLLREANKILRLQAGWREALQQRHIEWLLLHADAPLAVVLEGEDEYAPLYQDDLAVLLVRRGGVNQALLDAAEHKKLKLPPTPAPSAE